MTGYSTLLFLQALSSVRLIQEFTRGMEGNGHPVCSVLWAGEGEDGC